MDQGVRQYVILGAGFDTFAFRRRDLLDRLQVFEVDHPATQALKRERLTMLAQAAPAQLHLSRSILRPSACPTCSRSRPTILAKRVSLDWLGVTYYLTREVVFDTLRDVAAVSPQGSVMVFDYMDADAFQPGRAAKRIQLMQAIARQVGEPMQAGFDPFELAAESIGRVSGLGGPRPRRDRKSLLPAPRR